MMSDPPAASAFSKDQPFPAYVTENRLLNGPGSAKDTRHLVISLAGSGITYEAGDSLGVSPVNRPEAVDAIIAAIGATGNEPVLPAMLRLQEAISLRAALSERLALAGPTTGVLALLARQATAPTERMTLSRLLAPESKPELTAFLAAREFEDLLVEFPSAARATAPQELVDQMRKLMPRLYSIASSPRLHPAEVHLTVAVVRYESNGRPRHGVCSTFLADRVELGATPVRVFVSHSHFRPPENAATDIIMVGPGTGIAPFRAFVQERSARLGSGRNWVFFGDQHAATDFLYEEEWKRWQQSGVVARLDTAFSRDQTAKIYVQDRMREQAAELWRWLKSGAYFYVCGDAKRMAKDVDQALQDIVREQGQMDAPAAVEYVKQLKRDRRYQRDVY